ncbi:MAG: Ger(x)C family spore germination C-terminal domain-containing protein [Christensenellales bacterium]
MQKLFKMKSMILVIFIVACTFLGRTINTFSISERNVVLMLGIDYNGTNYIVTTQVVSPTSGAGAESASADNFVTVSAEAPTVTQGLEDIGSKIGRTLSLAHCNIVVLSKQSLLNNPDSFLNNLITSWLLPLNSVVVAVEGKPEDIIKLKVPTSENIAFYLQTLMLTEKKSLVTKTHVNSFLTDYASKSKTVTLPVCIPTEVDEDSILASQQGTGKYVTINLKNNFAVSRDGNFMKLDENTVNVTNLLKRKINNAYMTIEYDDYKIEYQIVKSSTKMKYDENRVTAEFKADIAISEIESKTFSEYLLSKEFKQEFLSALEKDLTEKMKNAFDLSKANQFDFLMLRNLAWQEEGLNFNSDNFWENLSFKSEIDLSLIKS